MLSLVIGETGNINFLLPLDMERQLFDALGSYRFGTEQCTRKAPPNFYNGAEFPLRAHWGGQILGCHSLECRSTRPAMKFVNPFHYVRGCTPASSGASAGASEAPSDGRDRYLARSSTNDQSLRR